LWILKFVGGASKVTQDVVASVMQEDIFNLQVTVDNRSFALMEAGNSFAGITKYLKHFILRKTCLQALVHQVDHLASPAEVHQNEHFPYITTAHVVDTGVNVTDNVLVPR